MNKITKKTISVRRARKNLYSGALTVGGVLGLIASFLVSFLVSGAIGMISIAAQNADGIAMFFAIASLMAVLAILALCLVPTVFALYNIFTLFYKFSVKPDEIERIKPYEKARRKRESAYKSSVYYLHGLYFAGGGRFFTESNPDEFHIGDRYFVARSGDKILMIYKEESYELSE